MKPQETVDFNIKTCWHSIYKMYNNEAAKYNSSTAVGFVLLNIDIEHGTPATKIAPLLGMESRSLTRMLKSLEQNEIIERRSDPSDKRLVRIFLTQKGMEKREIARKSVRKFNQKIRDIIPQDQLATFFLVIQTIHKTAENLKNLSE